MAAGATLHELAVHRSSLEQAFLELTGGANQYAGQQMPGLPDAGFFVPSQTGGTR
jgi:hypothetical protein